VLAAPPLAAVSSIAHVKQPICVLELLVTTSPGGGPKHVWDLVQHLPRSEFELVIGAPRDGIFFDRFRDRISRVKVSLHDEEIECHVEVAQLWGDGHHIDVGVPDVEAEPSPGELEGVASIEG